MSFNLTRGNTLTPIDAMSESGLQHAVTLVGQLGGAILRNLPDEIQHPKDDDAREWSRRVSGILAPVIREVYPDLLPADYRMEGRTQTHHCASHVTVHQDPTYRDSIFFGATGGATSAEFRLALHMDEPTQVFAAEPGTMWLMGGPSLFPRERTGGKRGGVWHEVSAPHGPKDRQVAIGSFIRPRSASI